MPRQPATDDEKTRRIRGTLPHDSGIMDRMVSDSLVAQNDLGIGSGSGVLADPKPPMKQTSPSPPPPRTVSKQAFKENLGQAWDKAILAKFGTTRSVRRNQFDHANFTSHGDYLQLNIGVPPSAAIDAIFASNGVWSFDCFEFAEVAQLYALRESLGHDADEQFNRIVKDAFTPERYRKRGTAPPGTDLLQIRVHPTGGLPILYWYVVEVEQKTDRTTGLSIPKPIKGPLIQTTPRTGLKMPQELARFADVGALVTFTNLNSKPGPWENENTVALGGGKFLAWPMGRDVSAQQVAEKLAKEGTAPTNLEAIFITGVTVPKIPWR